MVKQKSFTQFNILWVAISVLLIFVIAMHIGGTGSWLSKDETIVFKTQVVGININIQQTLNKGKEGESTVEIVDGGPISLQTNIIEADTDYPLDVTVTNGESGLGYYIRYKALAMVNGTEYNINNLIDTDFYVKTDGWAYHTASSGSATPTQMAANSTRNMLNSFRIPSTAGSGLSIGTLQGKHFKLYIYIEGSATGFGA